VLGERGDGVDAQFFLGDQNRSGFGDAEWCSDDCDVDVGRCGPVGELGRGDGSDGLGDRRVDALGVGKRVGQPSLQVVGRLGDGGAVEACEGGGEQAGEVIGCAGEVGDLR
jgi:hypothetical protein